LVDVSKYIERAEQEARRKNFDHAVTLYAEILQIDPDCGPARSGLRVASLKKLEKRYPSAIERGVLTLGPRLLLPLASAFKAHRWVASLCEQALRRDPRNVRLNHRLGHALLALGLRNAAEAAFKVVTEFDPNDIGSLKILGRLYAERKEVDLALACFERALKINPRDQEAGKLRKDLAAETAIRKGGFQEARSSRELAKSDRQIVEAERAQRIVQSSSDLDSALAGIDEDLTERPEDPRLHAKRARLLGELGRFEAALQAAARARELAPDSAEAEDLAGDLRLQQLEAGIREAEAEGGEGAEDRVRRLRRTLRDTEREELRRRVAAHPTDGQLRFRLGRLLQEDGLGDEAIEQLQQAVKDPKYRLAALQLLGRAFAAQGLIDLAVKQYSEAISRIAGMNSQKKELLYELAQVHDRDGKSGEALELYKQIYEADISFRDVADRIKSLSKAP
jgi:tetratricopeptide (TPR) repeat protein